MASDQKLLGTLSFVSRTFEGSFRENPYVLDMDANLYIGPADHQARDEHSAIEVVFHFLRETGRIGAPLRDLLRDRRRLLEAFDAFDESRSEAAAEDFRVFIFGTYDGEPLIPVSDDDLPAGPCGVSVNAIKQRLYDLCARMDGEFETRELSDAQRDIEARFGCR